MTSILLFVEFKFGCWKGEVVIVGDERGERLRG